LRQERGVVSVTSLVSRLAVVLFNWSPWFDEKEISR